MKKIHNELQIYKKEGDYKERLREVRIESKEVLEQVIDMLGFPVTANQVILAIFEEEDGELERRKLINFFVKRVPEPQFINLVFRIINGAWLLFPHERLNGKAPIELPQL